MTGYILRRLLLSVLIVLAASFIMYILAANSGDPLQDLAESNQPNKSELIAARTALLRLDVAPPARWFLWLGGVAGCLLPGSGLCDLGYTVNNSSVLALLPTAMASTLQLVTGAMVLAILLGVIVGMVTALRQHSGFDLAITFVSFFLFSLPSFLIAVLLKEFLAIGFNDFLQGKIALGPLTLTLIGVSVGICWQLLIGGDVRRRIVTCVVSGGATAVVLSLLVYTGWFTQPGLGLLGIALLSTAMVAAVVWLSSSIRNTRLLLIGGLVSVFGLLASVALQGQLGGASLLLLVGVALLSLLVGAVTGALLGGEDRWPAARLGVLFAAGSGALVLLDRLMQAWPEYVAHARVSGRPIATVGSHTPGFTGDFWLQGLDSLTHLLLPTVALLLVSFAGYTRYARAGLLEVMNQDYIRTARAKGLPERTVVLRHALRNMLIPLATLVGSDVGALLGGAVITETVFAIPGMGSLFNNALHRVDLNPIMAYFLVIAVMTVLCNLLVDLAYAALDPRVRVAAGGA